MIDLEHAIADRVEIVGDVMTLEHASTKTSGFRFTLAHARGLFYEDGASECANTQAGLNHNEPMKEVSNDKANS